MALDKPLESYIPGIPSGESISLADIPATVSDVAGATLQAVLDDIASRLGDLENA